MMLGKCVCKVPGGKLLKVSVEHEGGRIVWVNVTGDFFMHPEDAVERLEERLKGAGVDDVDGIVRDSMRDVGLYGVDVDSIVKSIMEAVK